MDDLVTRLCTFSLDDGTEALNKLLTEAAIDIEQLQQWKDLAYEMRNKSWWAMRSKVLIKFDVLHMYDWHIYKLRRNA